MNEPENRAASFFVEQTVPNVQAFDKRRHPVAEPILRIAVMMQVDFNVADSRPGQSRKIVHHAGMILLFRVEEGIAGGPASAVTVSLRDIRPPFHPALHAL